MDHVAVGTNDQAPFTLTVRRGEGMALLSMNWRSGSPPDDFVGFSISYAAPWDPTKFVYVSNRLTFQAARRDDSVAHRSLNAPIQMFRWVSFPPFPRVWGEYTFRVEPAFMDDQDQLSHGEHQQAAMELGGFTRPGELDVAFTRGFVSSQAFVDRYELDQPAEMATLIPGSGADPLTFVPSYDKADDALEWMGFQARDRILRLLDQAIADPTAQVRVVAYDLNLREMVDRLAQLGDRLQIIIDDSVNEEGKGHGETESPETHAAERLEQTAGADQVSRQHVGGLQHNKFIAVGGEVQRVLCGSTNFSWRGVYVQNNHVVQLLGEEAVGLFTQAFDAYREHGTQPADFAATELSGPHDLTWPTAAARVTFSPHTTQNAMLQAIADDITSAGVHSVLYSLAFLSQTEGPVRAAIKRVTEDPDVFVYGIADKRVGGIDVQGPDGNVQPVFPENLSENVPEPFRSEPTGGGGIRMHHKFVVLNFGKPDARVWLGSYNFSSAADRNNGENLVLVRDPVVAASFAIEALRIFDHYSFRVKQQDAQLLPGGLLLRKPPRIAGDDAWWQKYYDAGPRQRDRLLFA